MLRIMVKSFIQKQHLRIYMIIAVNINGFLSDKLKKIHKTTNIIELPILFCPLSMAHADS
jgi:hypothetical protein